MESVASAEGEFNFESANQGTESTYDDPYQIGPFGTTNVDDIPEDKLFSELTDDEVIELSKKSYSVKGFLLDFNGDYLDPSSEFTRLIIK